MQRDPAWQLVGHLCPPLGPGHAQQVLERVTALASRVGLRHVQLERLEQAVVGALCHAAALGTRSGSSPEIAILVWATAGVGTTDGLRPVVGTAEHGQGTGCGWGFFLVERDEADPQFPGHGRRRVLELFLYEGLSEHRVDETVGPP